MKIAIVSDVHGNLPALQTALHDARKRGADRILGAGDWVGYGPYPADVVTCLRDRGIRCISGNYDIKTVRAIRQPDYYSGKLRPFKWEILDWTRRQLNENHVEWLSNLPGLLDLEPFDGCRILVCHGWPHNDTGRIYPDLTAEMLRRLTRGFIPQVLVAGHTHVPFVRRLDGCLVINAGSTGQPVDGDTRPCYGMIEILPDKPPVAEIIRFEYPLSRLLSAIRQSGLPQWLYDDFQHGVKRKHPVRKD